MNKIRPLIALAERQINLGNPRGAIGPLREAVAADPDHALAQAYLAMCLQEVARPADARSEMKAALAAAPDVGFIRYAAGMVMLRQRSWNEAERHLTRARELMIDHGETHRLLAIVYGRTRRAHLALSTLQEGLRHEPLNVRILADLGTMMILSGRLEDAEQRAAEALRINPESPEAHVLSGHIRLYQRRRNEAREHALAALSRNATYEPALRLLASSKLQNNFLIGTWWRFAICVARHRDSGIAMAVSMSIFAILYLAGRIVC